LIQEEELFNKYTEKLELLNKSFNRDPIAPFIGINLREGPVPAFGDWFSAWQSDTIHLYSDQAPIFEKLLDFSALVSYMSLAYRRSLYFLHVVFLLRFQTSLNPTFKKICAKIYEGVANEQEKAKADYLLYYRQIIDFLTEEKFLLDYLPILPISLTFYEFYQSFYPIWYDLRSKGFRFEDITKLFSVTKSNLSLFFSKKKKLQQKGREIYQKYLGISFLSMQYDKIGLSTYYGTLILNPLLHDPAKIILEIANKPIFQGFAGTNLEYQFFIIIPEAAKSNVTAYFRTLKSNNSIIHFKLQKYMSYKTVLQYNSRISKSTLVGNVFPFISSDWKFVRARKSMMQKQSLNVSSFEFTSQRKKKPARTFQWTPLHLYLSFTRNKLFTSLFHYENPSSFFQFVQQNILSFFQSFNFNITPRVIKKIANCSNSGDNITKTMLDSNYSDENRKIINEIASILNYNLINGGYYPSWEKMWKEYLFIQDAFRKKQKISKIALHKAIIQLIESQIIQENRQLQLLEIVRDSWDCIYTLVETPQRINILEESLMIYTLEKFRTDEGNFVYRYQLAIPAKYWTSFSRLFFDIQNCRFFCPFQQVYYENAEDLLFYFDYPAQSWNVTKFNVQPFQSNVINPCYVHPSNLSQTSHQRVSAAETIYHFSHIISTTQRWNLITDRLMKSQDKYLKFVNIWIERKQMSEECMKNFLKDNFSLDFNQVSHIIQKINFHTVPLPQYRNMQKVVLILQEYFFPCHPEILLADQLLSSLFCHGLQRISVSSGGSNGILILEYELPTAVLENSKSQINQILAKINQYFNINLHFFVINNEYRFYSEQLVHRNTLKSDGFSHLIFKKNEDTFLNPHHICYTFVEKMISTIQPPPVYCFSTWNWSMWQMIGYPIEIGIILKIDIQHQRSVIKYLMKFPIGQILVSKGDKNESEVTIIAKLRCVKNVLFVLKYLSEYFNLLKIRSYISLLTDYAIIQNNMLSNLISQSQNLNKLRTNEGDLLEIPLIRNDKIFSLQERLWLYSFLEIETRRCKLNISPQTWRSFLEALCKIENICLAGSEIDHISEIIFKY
jgi:hypothetical protein